jgi:Uri superfamily endonuclease
MSFSTIPRERGVYILIISITSATPLSLPIGFITLEPGLYAYIGSARAFGGLRSRLKHHLTKDKKRLWWHIDYLTSKSCVEAVSVIYALTELDLERPLAEALGKAICWKPAAKGFGATDKKSFTHLYKCTCNASTCINEALETVRNLAKNVGITWIKPLTQL